MCTRTPHPTPRSLCPFQEEELRDAVLLVFANKQDMDGAMTSAEVTQHLGLTELASGQHRTWSIFKTSATKGEGLNEGLEWYVFATRLGA